MFCGQVITKVTTLHQVQDQVQCVPILEGVIDVDQKRRVQAGQKKSFVHDALDAFLGHDPT